MPTKDYWYLLLITTFNLLLSSRWHHTGAACVFVCVCVDA